ncbi:2OG-Fe(II) oxygenase [Nonomuraea mesophila]|uniref:2OG-Fe(II) oxygenase n=1 Tax=Nonomuraea mesophila TaxID=2530382 RepID=A0A4R5FUY9_9ACTN|nr:2OG-Fe(II) oxygenase [Nonomuraea mesophila]TDE57393.1 2OG-Fe(II) oxygenase [Nonomuraea mesophila]
MNDISALLYRGRPQWVTDELLAGLVSESQALRPQAQVGERQFYRRGGDAAAAVAFSAELRGLVEQHVKPAAPTHFCDYLYYDREGDGIDPHVDTEEFPLNVLMMLVHEGEERSSNLVLFPSGGPETATPVPLRPGELVLFRANEIIHARSRLAAGERVHLLTFGFRRAAA